MFVLIDCQCSWMFYVTQNVLKPNIIALNFISRKLCQWNGRHMKIKKKEGN